jgi:hypothetical protein
LLNPIILKALPVVWPYGLDVREIGGEREYG